MTIRKKIPHTRYLAWGLLVLVIVGVLLAGHDGTPSFNPLRPAVAHGMGSLSANAQETTPFVGGTAGTPPDVPVTEWQQVVAAQRAVPGGVQDLPRIGAYLTFLHRVARWQQLRAQDDTSEARTQLAQFLLDDLPAHVGHKEVTAFEAKALAAQLLEYLVPDAGERQLAMAQQTARMSAAQPVEDALAMQQEQARMTAYKQRESAITAQWMAMSPAARDPQWLETQLDAARRSTLGIAAAAP